MVTWLTHDDENSTHAKQHCYSTLVLCRFGGSTKEWLGQRHLELLQDLVLFASAVDNRSISDGKEYQWIEWVSMTGDSALISRLASVENHSNCVYLSHGTQGLISDTLPIRKPPKTDQTCDSLLSAILIERYIWYYIIYGITFGWRHMPVFGEIQPRMLEFCPETESLQDLCMLVFHLQK